MAGLGGAGGGLPNLEGGGAGADQAGMQQLREAVASNPAMLQGIIQGLVANNPALAQQLSQNPEMLLQLLGGLGDDGEDGDDIPGAAGGQQTISLTQDEMEAIQRVSLCLLDARILSC